MAYGLEFAIIGAQKGGTTTLWELIRDHPQIWVPETKESERMDSMETTIRSGG